MLSWSCKVEEFSILERKVRDLLNKYESLLSEQKALTDNILYLNKVKLELENMTNSFKEEKTILEADKRNIIDNLNILKEERDNLLKQLEATRIEKDNLKLNIDKTERDSISLIEENDNLKNKIQSINLENETLKRENNELKGKLSQLISTIDSAMKYNQESNQNINYNYHKEELIIFKVEQ